MLKKIIILLSIILIIFIFTILVWFILNPLFKKEKKIRDDLLKVIPMSTTMEEAIQLIKENKKWEIEEVQYNAGFYFNPYYGYPEDGEARVIGEKYLYVYLGSYHIVYEIDVIAYFGFDENDELIEIYVEKQPDSP
jgi:ABC-type glycerol-3-phosphate transport system permease component